MEKNIRIRRKSPTACYSGSLIQQNFGESIDKGYLLWDTDTCEHERKFIMNDYGFVKIDIAKGENIEDRLEYVKFSNDKKKSKIYITWEDYEENYSIEKENQIKRFVRDNHGCENVRIQFNEITKEIIDLEDSLEINQYNFEDVFKDWVNDGEFDLEDSLMEELLIFSREVDKVLEIDESQLDLINDWDINSIEISNILSFDKKPIKINFDNIKGLTGVFGKNFNGKSNVVKAIVWGLYNEILGGNQSSSKYLVNIYTDSNVGYVTIMLTINGEIFRIHRQITSKNGKNTFFVKCEKLVKKYDENGEYIEDEWVDKVSDRKTAEQREVQQLVRDTIGIFDDFTKTSLQAQGGSGDYISQQQQPKNNLISRFFGLETYNTRHEYAKTFFNDIKRKQKDLGNVVDIEGEIINIVSKIDSKTIEYELFKQEKSAIQLKQEKVNEEIISLTKKLDKIEDSGIINKTAAKSEVLKINELIIEDEKIVAELEDWLSKNFKKELPFKGDDTIESLSAKINSEELIVKKSEEELVSVNLWISKNPFTQEKDVSNFTIEIENFKADIVSLKSKLLTYQGKCCPTCGHIEHMSDPIKEMSCLSEIKMNEELIAHKSSSIGDNDLIVLNNKKIDTSKERASILEQLISTKKESIKLLQVKLDLINNSKDIIEHNNLVETKSNKVSTDKIKIESNKKKVKEIEDNIKLFDSNISKIENNEKIQELINTNSQSLKGYQLSSFNLDNVINVSFGEIKVLESNKNAFSAKLNEIKDSERLFKKYSIYLQAVHRDGIPAAIIRKKLPIVNGKINSILMDVVDFKIELEILVNGDIVETFFFSDDKSDALPLASASGSQKFIASIVITEALRHMSRLTKPSIRIIDEGFGSLDDELTIGIVNVLNYLRNKYNNVLFITHRNEIKDFADNIIEVVKIPGDLSEEVLKSNPKAGISKVTIK